MAKWANDLVMDAALDFILNNASREIVCSAQPTTYAEANATYALADVAVVSGDFTKANGDVSGRKVGLAAKNSVLIDVSGSATHIALVDDTNSRLLYVTTCTTQALVANGANTTNIPAWDVEIADPA
jgi:hypothetical protein